MNLRPTPGSVTPGKQLTRTATAESKRR
jgi:hypothetical protein